MKESEKVVIGVIVLGIAIYILCKLRPKGTVTAMESESHVTPNYRDIVVPGNKVAPTGAIGYPGLTNIGLPVDYEVEGGARRGSIGFAAEFA